MTDEMLIFLETIGCASYDIPIGPSYILPNGKFLHYKANFISKKPIHPVWQLLFNNKFKFVDFEQLTKQDVILDNGCVRVNDATVYNFDYYITLPSQELNDKQYLSLTLYLDYLNIKGRYSKIAISVNNDSSLLYHDNLDDVDSIIKKIKCYYNTQR